jgi:hypothetical protein
MANEKRLIPCGEKCTLEELPCGTLFAFGDDCIAVKSEYRCNNGLIEAFIIDSGEQFWGGVHTAEEQNALMVQPLEAVEVAHGRWEHDCVEGCNPFVDSLPIWVDVMQCSVCKEYIEGSHGTNYCPNCGAKMDGDGNA